MTDYTQTTQFTFRDALAAGDPRKKGVPSLFEGQFDLMVSESSTKANKKVPGTTNNVAKADGGGDLADSATKVHEFAYVTLADPELVDSFALDFGDLGNKITFTQGAGSLATANATKWRFRVQWDVTRVTGTSTFATFNISIYNDASDATAKTIVDDAHWDRGVTTLDHTVETEWEFTNGNEIVLSVDSNLLVSEFTSSALRVYVVGYYQ